MSLIKALPLVHVLLVPSTKRFQYCFHFFTSGRLYCRFHGHIFRKLPQTFLSFCLGMSSKKDLSESTIPSIDNPNKDNTEHVEPTNIADPPRPTSQASNGSRSTDESVTAFIERTVTAMNLPEPESTVVLPVREGAIAHSSTMTFIFQKASVSEAITITPSQSIGPAGLDDKEETTSQEEAAPLYGDTTDAEELLDSSGVVAFSPISHIVTLDPENFPDIEWELHLESGHSHEEQEAYRAKLETYERQLSAKERTIIFKFYTAATPIRLPVGHPTVAFNQEQMQAILRTVADESALSSYHMMKSLLLQALTGTSQDKKKENAQACPTPARHLTKCSGEEDSQAGNVSDGYTSGAIYSDEDPINLDQSLVLMWLVKRTLYRSRQQ